MTMYKLYKIFDNVENKLEMRKEALEDSINKIHETILNNDIK